MFFYVAKKDIPIISFKRNHYFFIFCDAIILLWYAAYFLQYKSYLVTAHIDTLYPDKFDEFIQAKEERQAEMSRLKRRLINYGLPSEELYELGEEYKKDIRVLAEEIIRNTSI